jgi:hypothetical protein
MTIAEIYFNEITDEIQDVKPGRMFGALCIKTPNGKAAAMFWKDYLVVKLQGSALEEAKSLTGVTLFDPMDGRPMKEWVQIPFEHKDKWKKYALLSAESVKLLPKKESKKK